MKLNYNKYLVLLVLVYLTGFLYLIVETQMTDRALFGGDAASARMLILVFTGMAVLISLLVLVIRIVVLKKWAEKGTTKLKLLILSFVLFALAHNTAVYGLVLYVLGLISRELSIIYSAAAILPLTFAFINREKWEQLTGKDE